MDSETAAASRNPGRTVAVAVLVIIAVLAIAAGILYLVEPAKSLPAILGTISHPPSRANAHRPVRGVTALAVGVVCLVAAWWVGRRSMPRRG